VEFLFPFSFRQTFNYFSSSTFHQERLEREQADVMFAWYLSCSGDVMQLAKDYAQNSEWYSNCPVDLKKWAANYPKGKGPNGERVRFF
jgi:hypothetical protein